MENCPPAKLLASRCLWRLWRLKCDACNESTLEKTVEETGGLVKALGDFVIDFCHTKDMFGKDLLGNIERLLTGWNHYDWRFILKRTTV